MLNLNNKQQEDRSFVNYQLGEVAFDLMRLVNKYRKRVGSNNKITEPYDKIIARILKIKESLVSLMSYEIWYGVEQRIKLLVQKDPTLTHVSIQIPLKPDYKGTRREGRIDIDDLD